MSIQHEHGNPSEYIAERVQLIERIQTHMLDLANHYKNGEFAFDRHRSFSLDPFVLAEATLPAFISDHINAGFELTEAEIGMSSSAKDTENTVINITFYLNDASNARLRVIDSRIPKSNDTAANGTIISLEQTTESAIQRDDISSDEIYTFMASLLMQTDDSFTKKYLNHPKDFIPYLTNAFSIDEVATMLQTITAESFTEDDLLLDDPITTLPTSMIFRHVEDEFIRAEITAWSDHDKTDEITIIQNALDSGLRFEKDGQEYDPTLQDLEEFCSRLEDISEYAGASTELPVADEVLDDNKLN